MNTLMLSKTMNPMSKADLYFKPAEQVTTPDGRTLRYWGKYPTKTSRESRTMYVFFDVETDRCIEMRSNMVLRLRRCRNR